jgi:hypothetical protein
MEEYKYIYKNLDQFVASKLTQEDDENLDRELNAMKNDIEQKNKLFNDKMRSKMSKLFDLKKSNNLIELKELEENMKIETKLNELENLDYNKKVQDTIYTLREKFFKLETGFTLKEFEELYNNQ